MHQYVGTPRVASAAVLGADAVQREQGVVQHFVRWSGMGHGETIWPVGRDGIGHCLVTARQIHKSQQFDGHYCQVKLSHSRFSLMIYYIILNKLLDYLQNWRYGGIWKSMWQGRGVLSASNGTKHHRWTAKPGWSDGCNTAQGETPIGARSWGCTVVKKASYYISLFLDAAFVIFSSEAKVLWTRFYKLVIFVDRKIYYLKNRYIFHNHSITRYVRNVEWTRRSWVLERESY